MYTKEEIKEYTGSVSVEANVTPITRKPVNQVTPDQWENMVLQDLWEQKAFLLKRYYIVQAAGQQYLMTPIQTGIDTITEIITAKSKQLEDKLL
jgi:hypothetical protein